MRTGYDVQQGDGTPESTATPASTPAGKGPNGQPLPYTAQQADDFTRQVASSLGMNPDEASRVLRQESSFGQSYVNPRDPMGSYGPFQLNMQPGSLGQAFKLATGEDPRDPANWRDQIVFALRYAQTHGWGKAWRTTANKLGLRGDPAGDPKKQIAWNYGQDYRQTDKATTPTGDTKTPNVTIGGMPATVQGDRAYLSPQPNEQTQVAAYP